MATTVECQDFTTGLIGTEGIGAVGASRTMAMSLLTLTTLFSSFLIYIQLQVPQKVDLNNMRCFSQLTSSLLAQCGESISTDSRRAYFPNFLWLLQDVRLPQLWNSLPFYFYHLESNSWSIFVTFSISFSEYESMYVSLYLPMCCLCLLINSN